MRTPSFLTAALMLASTGCAEVCEPSTSLTNRTWDVFVNPLEWELTNAEAFPGEGSPANGAMVMSITLDPGLEGIGTVNLDGQTFDADFNWDDAECGNFVLNFNGQYESELGSKHGFAMGGIYLVYDEHIEAEVVSNETWQIGQQTGTYVMDGQLRGIERGVGTGSAQ